MFLNFRIGESGWNATTLAYREGMRSRVFLRRCSATLRGLGVWKGAMFGLLVAITFGLGSHWDVARSQQA